MNNPSTDMTTSQETRRVFVEGLVLSANIGCYDHEHVDTQPVRIDFVIDVKIPDDPLSDSLEDALCYDRLTASVKDIIAEGHIMLVETLAERIASLAIAHPMAMSVTIRVGKPNAINEAQLAGVEITRIKTEPTP